MRTYTAILVGLTFVPTALGLINAELTPQRATAHVAGSDTFERSRS